MHSKKCRFCGNELANQEEVKGEVAPDADVCLRKECRDMLRENCNKILPCGHPCKGFNGELECLPCLNAECIAKARAEDPNNRMLPYEGTDEDSFCTICWVSGLGSEPCIRLGCGHIFHVNCIK